MFPSLGTATSTSTTTAFLRSLSTTTMSGMFATLIPAITLAVSKYNKQGEGEQTTLPHLTSMFNQFFFVNSTFFFFSFEQNEQDRKANVCMQIFPFIIVSKKIMRN